MISERLNRNCFCVSLDPLGLRQALLAELGTPELVKLIEERCPYLFSSRPVFISDSQAAQFSDLVSAVEAVVALPTYQQHVLANAPEIARHGSGGAKGVFFGYDFHVSNETVGVIEVNTNAGGAMLNAVVARAHHACCLDDERIALATYQATNLEKSIMEMFFAEWNASGRTRPLRTVAIVDSAPEQQYLYPEFLLFHRLFQRNGIQAIIADPSALDMRGGLLMHGDIEIDLTYNRSTDFMLEQPESASLQLAYLENAVVLTPHPQAHALYANKGNLALLCDERQLQAFGAPQEVRDVLAKHMLKTEIVEPSNADRLWSERRTRFFKPLAGFGSRAAYRGDKLTKRVWQEIISGGYIAQQILAPGKRVAGTKDQPEQLKFDIRCYTYAGAIQWTAARMYQGQTTNFRTAGGGFAPVYSLPDKEVVSQMDAANCCTKMCN
ncbi:hypothetical protein [Noviherbaspirillum aerium]|uniref:hypothetical protein n=1 Tax=Noviherbaspirillum aerium TaxID=2588497 RepID=UPI001CEF9727|nr:hypothetical protein [Noviherbaspirillum aerium]